LIIFGWGSGPRIRSVGITNPGYNPDFDAPLERRNNLIKYTRAMLAPNEEHENLNRRKIYVVDNIRYSVGALAARAG
jgi:hypothetical protein